MAASPLTDIAIAPPTHRAVIKSCMAAANDFHARISAAAGYLTEGGHHEVADALQLVLVGADDLPACMGAASGWRSHAERRQQMEGIDRLITALSIERERAAVMSCGSC